jgi:hypothetical protein
MAAGPMIEMRGVGKWFGRFQVLKDVDLCVAQEFVSGGGADDARNLFFRNRKDFHADALRRSMSERNIFS